MTEVMINLQDKGPLKPVGCIVTFITDSRKRNKWTEIVCNLMSPKNRGTYQDGFRDNLGWSKKKWDAIVGLWTQERRDAWFEAQQGIDSPERDLRIKAVWDEYIASVPGWIDEMGKDPTGTTDITNTWLWSFHEKRSKFITTNLDAVKAELESWSNREKGKIVVAKVDFENKMNLSNNRKLAIKNKDTIVHPIFDRAELSKEAIEWQPVI